jgi:vacuolar-type H+-ATPase subunit C/Vma6
MTKDNQLKYDQLEQDKLLLHVMLLLWDLQWIIQLLKAKVEQLTEDIQQSKLSNGSYTSDIETKSSISMPIKSIFDDSCMCDNFVNFYLSPLLLLL